MAKKKMTLEEKLEEAIVKEAPYEVPENWIWSKLDSVSILVTGNTPSKKNVEYYGENVPFIKPNDLDQGRRLKSSIEMLSSLGAEKARILPKGSTAVCCIGSIGKTAYLEVEGATNQQINSIIPQKVNNLYIYYCVLSEYFQRELVSNSSATTIAIINKSKMGELAVPIPPLKEQQRIVDKIESLFEKLDKAKELIEEARDDFEKRKSAILEKAFRGELTKAWRNKKNIEYKDSWKSGIFEDLCVLSRGFDLPSRLRVEGEYLLVSSSGAIDTHNEAKMRAPGVVTGRSGSIGKVFYIEKDFWPLNTTLYVKDFKGNYEKYVYYYLSKFDFKKYSSSTAVPTLNRNNFKGVSITLPCLEEQKEIVRILDSLLDQESKIEELTILEDQIELIKKSILAKAFRGQLGTNCEEDESALELLKEILQKE